MKDNTIDQFGSISRTLIATVFAALPELEAGAAISSGREVGQGDESDGFSAYINIASPTGEPGRSIVLFLSNGDPSLTYGPCHIHCAPDDEGMTEIVNLIQKIIMDVVVIAEEIQSKYDNYADWFDLSDTQSLAEEMTSPYSSGKFRLKSWTGTKDGDFDLSDLPYDAITGAR